MDQRGRVQQRRREEAGELVLGATGLGRFPLIPLSLEGLAQTNAIKLWAWSFGHWDNRGREGRGESGSGRRRGAGRCGPPVAAGGQGSPARSLGRGAAAASGGAEVPAASPRLRLPPGQLTAQCGTVRPPRSPAALPAAAAAPPRSVPRARSVLAAMAGLVVRGTQVSYIGQDCREIPEHLGRDCGHFAKRLDLSFNLLRSLLKDSCPPSLPTASLCQGPSALGVQVNHSEQCEKFYTQSSKPSLHIEIV
nr:uncharacterized protein LOC109028642 [Gorilla gorilla gorilla]